jgi:hypothetical protein
LTKGATLAGSTTKKVLIRRFDREPLTGFVNAQTYLQPGGVELLTPAGALAVIPYFDIKVVCFVKDFDSIEPGQEKKVFNTRPKTDGLWVRMQLRDGEVLDGILSNNLLQLGPEGFTVTPPDAYSNNQRLFVPRAALTQFNVLGVVGSPLTRRKAKPAAQDQIGLFEDTQP